MTIDVHIGAFDRLKDALEENGCRPRDHGSYLQAFCPAHPDQKNKSLAVYRKPGKVKLVCFASCDDEIDILPALGLSWPDKYDEPRTGTGRSVIDPRIQAYIERRRSMTPTQRAVALSPCVAESVAALLENLENEL
jgi:hypothetical protein